MSPHTIKCVLIDLSHFNAVSLMIYAVLGCFCSYEYNSVNIVPLLFELPFFDWFTTYLSRCCWYVSGGVYSPHCWALEYVYFVAGCHLLCNCCPSVTLFVYVSALRKLRTWILVFVPYCVRVFCRFV